MIIRAHIEATTISIDLNALGDETGVTPLAMAGQQRKLKVVKLLLERGADVEAKDAEGNTALMSIAAYGPNPETLELLLKKGGRVSARNRSGATALDLARQGHARQENEAVLLRHGAVAKAVRSNCSPCH